MRAPSYMTRRVLSQGRADAFRHRRRGRIPRLCVQHYRAAQAIALRDERGEADTEELRKGIVPRCTHETSSVNLLAPKP